MSISPLSTIAETPEVEPVSVPTGPPRAVAPPVPPPGWHRAAAPVRRVAATSVSSVTSKIEDLLRKARQATGAFEDQIRPALDAAPRRKPCDAHSEVMLALDRQRSVADSWQHESGVRLVYTACQRCQREAEESAGRRYWTRRGVPNRVLDATFQTFESAGQSGAEKQKAMLDAIAFVAKAGAPIDPGVNTSLKRGGFLLIVGSTGTGKGHLAVSAMKALGEGGLFITQADLLSDLRTSYTDHTTADFLEKFKTTPCLVLDEVGVTVGGKDEAPMLYQILAARHDKRLPTIITSNEELPALKETLGYRLVDRIREDYTVITCRWESHRA